MSAVNQPPQIRVPRIKNQMTDDEIIELQNFLESLAKSVYLLWFKVGQATTFTTALQALTSAGAGTQDFAIQALSAGGYGFVTADEGETVLEVIENLQTRLAEVEAKLE